MYNLVRYLKKPVHEDLREKMVFIGGPRQVGKTYFSLSFLDNPQDIHPAYLNWDDIESRERIKTGNLPKGESLIILDEIHKYKFWRNLVKGFYDKQKSVHKFLVTGSARLDYYSKGGDSLFGRYHYYRMHPLSVGELGLKTSTDLDRLLEFGGFPEPYFKADPVFSRRWRLMRKRRIINEDLRDLEKVKEVSLIESLLDLIPVRVGSQLSYQSIANELEVNFRSIQNWVSILDQLYLTFRISPFVSGKLKLVKKTHRIFLWDWSEIEAKGSRFENMVASHLLKYCHFIEDTQGERMELRYLKSVDGHEVDFVVLKNKKPQFGVECKTGERNTSSSIHYFRERLNIPYFYQVHLGQRHSQSEDNVEIIPFIVFCNKIGIP